MAAFKKKAAAKRTIRSMVCPGGPTKPDYLGMNGFYAQYNAEFLAKLWRAGGTLRHELLNETDEAKLRTTIKLEVKIDIPGDIRLVVYDIQTATQNSFVKDACQEKFYVLVLPPKPRRHPDQPEYEEMQRWASAYYHATTDSYGM